VEFSCRVRPGITPIDFENSMSPTKRDSIAALVGLLVGVAASFGGFKTMPTAFCEGVVAGEAAVTTLDAGVTLPAVLSAIPAVVEAAVPIVKDGGLVPAFLKASTAPDAGK
jgi:hypothetical protein